MTRAHFHLYAVFISVATLVALGLALRRPPLLFSPRYWRWLLAPWKVATAAVSMTVLAVAGPLTGDPYWDMGVAVLMSILCFATAPWAVGELGRRGPARLVALVVWLWSTTWSYDLYWLMRRGFHPDDWLLNFVISSFLYAGAGILWNLEWSPSRRIHLAFRAPEWPSPPSTHFLRIFVPALALMALVGAVVLLPYAFVRP
jgi:hypothetical protein